MNLSIRARATLLRVVKILAFPIAIMATTKLTLEFGALASASTAAFSFLIIVLLAAYFGDLIVSITTSIIATFCYDFFYLPPVGTLNVAAFPDWISLSTFLMASVIISQLTASAAENKAKADMLSKTIPLLSEFGERLLSMPHENLTLSGIAKEALNIFSLEYCSIHVYGKGEWQHATGAAASNVSQEVEKRLKHLQDHSLDLMELTEENLLGVQYVRISKGATASAWLVVKDRNLPVDAIGVIATMIGGQLDAIMGDNHSKISS